MTHATRPLAIEKLGVTLAAMGVATATYLALERFNAADARGSENSLMLQTQLDTSVPLVPAFVGAYLLYYVWLLIPVVVIEERADFYRAMRAFLLVQLSASLIFVLFPAHMVRPSLVPAGLAGDLVRALYRVDRGWNVFPSLHVAHAVLVAEIVWVHRRGLFPLVACGSILIAASTVLIKQHYLIDVPAGALLALGCAHMAGLRAPRPLVSSCGVTARLSAAVVGSAAWMRKLRPNSAWR